MKSSIIYLLTSLAAVLLPVIANTWSKDIITSHIKKGNVPYTIFMWSALSFLLILMSTYTIITFYYSVIIPWPQHPESTLLLTIFLTMAGLIEITALFFFLYFLHFVYSVLRKNGNIVPKKDFPYLSYKTQINGELTRVWVIKEAAHDTFIVVTSIEMLNNSTFIALPTSSLQNKEFTYLKIKSQPDKKEK